MKYLFHLVPVLKMKRPKNEIRANMQKINPINPVSPKIPAVHPANAKIETLIEFN